MNLGHVENLSGSCSFPEAVITAADDSTISLTVSITGKGNLSIGTGTATLDKSGTSATFTNLTAALAQEVLRNITFTGCSRTTTINVTVDGNVSSELPSGATLAEYNGHYYMYVPTKLSWSSAYNAAKTYKFNGMQGYLATLTSGDEYRALNSKVRATGGWIGGTLIVYNDGKETKINDESSLTQTTEEFTYPATSTSYNNTRGNAIRDYYWACGPEAGSSFMDAVTNGLINMLETNEPNAYQHKTSQWEGQENLLGLTKYECCLLANNTGKLLINDITETGYQSTSFAEGYFVEFGGYAEGKDPGNPDTSLAATDSHTFAHEHTLSYSVSSDGTSITATCSNADGLCDISNTGVTLTLLSGESEYRGGIDSVWNESERDTWTTAGLALPTDVTITYAKTKDGESSTVDKIKNVGYYTISATVDGKTATSNLTVTKRTAKPGYVRAADKVYDGSKTAYIDNSTERFGK